MARFNFITILLTIVVICLSAIQCRPRSQKILVHGHEWTVPNEPGWEEVLQEAEPHRHHFLSNCASIRECRKAAEQLRRIFLKHPVSAKYYDDSIGNELQPSDFDSIFKWG